MLLRASDGEVGCVIDLAQHFNGSARKRSAASVFKEDIDSGCPHTRSKPSRVSRDRLYLRCLAKMLLVKQANRCSWAQVWLGRVKLKAWCAA